MAYEYITEKCVVGKRKDQPEERYHVNDLISVKLEPRFVERIPGLRYKLETGWLIGRTESIDVDCGDVVMDISREYNTCRLQFNVWSDVEEIKLIEKANLKGE